ncbi:hypothetical protein RR48_08254 [Papilio machaon]|uniref:Uncharacterized protein n=1 Tax=Papilio machaon TaxID=76193 RepID=A0A194RFL4_PAPMA|nr:hypothetical protein RR48_08254 [Papilio machaon]
MAQRMSFGLLGGAGGGAARCEFVRMKGPGGKGHAEVAVSRPRGAAPSSAPGSAPGLAAPWPDDMDDPEELFLFRHQRRLSDPSANIAGFVRGGWRARDPSRADHSRSENDGLDALGDGLAEVEAGDLRDAGCAWGGGVVREGSVGSTGGVRGARGGSQSVAFGQRSYTITILRGAALRLPSAEEGRAEGRAGWSAGARAYVTLPRRQRGVAAALFRRARLPPRRTTPDGTDIYYWCELPARAVHELDDGAYNPLWAMRGFTQTFHLWKEGKRQQSAPLNAYLTYVTLPWWAIAKDILDHREEPVLTF